MVQVSETSINNKRIARNTLYMYLRMFFTMCVSLYTSRVVLNTLGFIDYGLYNVVCGVIALFGFINGAMVNTISRYLTFYIGKGHPLYLNKIFSQSCLIQVLIGIIVVALGETIGLWFLHNKMTIPIDRMNAAEWVYQLSIIQSFFLILNVPYSASVISNEKMSIYAYISILESVLKLAIVYLIVISPFDKLVFYAMLLCSVQLLNFLIYRIYAILHFPECKIKLYWNRKMFIRMFQFAGWSTIGNLFFIFYTQGVNIILNMFCGPAVNAARGVAVHVQGVIAQFATNVQTAVNPQIIKSYAQNELKRMYNLIFASSRFCFYLLYLIAFPLIIQSEYILGLWLGKYPEHTVNFLTLILITVLLDTLINPMFTANLATGKIKIYHIANSINAIVFIPIVYFSLKITKLPEIVFFCLILMSTIGILIRLFILRKQTGIKMSDYFKNVILKIIPVCVLPIFLMLPIKNLLHEGFGGLIETVVTTTSLISLSIYFFGINSKEKSFVKQKIRTFLKKS